LHSVSQWWQRAKRCGYAYAQVSHMQGSPERKFIKRMANLDLGGDRAVSALALTPSTHGLSWIAFGRYPLTVLQVIYKTRRQGSHG